MLLRIRRSSGERVNIRWVFLQIIRWNLQHFHHQISWKDRFFCRLRSYWQNLLLWRLIKSNIFCFNPTLWHAVKTDTLAGKFFNFATLPNRHVSNGYLSESERLFACHFQWYIIYKYMYYIVGYRPQPIVFR